MAGTSVTSPIVGGLWLSGAGGGGFSGRDIVWVDLRFPAGVGNNGTEELPFPTANNGLGVLPDGGTLIMVGGDASTEPGVTIGSKSANFLGRGAQISGGTLPPAALPTLTYAITSGAQRLAFERISASIVHSGTVAGLTSFFFSFCPVIQLSAGGDTAPVYCVGDRTCSISGSGGAAHLRGIVVAGYVANGGGSVFLSNAHVTTDVTSTTSITFHAGTTFGGALSITAPSISIDPASHKNAVAAGVTFSSTPQLLAVFGTPVDIGTANSAGTQQAFAHADHIHNLPFAAVVAALALASSSVGFNNQRITGLAAPVSANDAVRLTDLQAAIQGLQVKTAAVAVATANQATLSGTAQTIDGVALNTIGMRVLLTAQSTATQNGLWVVQSGAWTRPADYATGAHAALSYVPISGGTLWAGSSYYCTTASGSDTIDTNTTAWTIFNIPATVTAGAGLTKTGTTIDVVAADATIVVNADSIQVGVIGNANLADNTVALSRMVNAGAQYDFMMRKSAGSGPWEDATLAQAQAALGIVASGALKAVRAATTANITLSGTQTIDGVACVAGDRVLAKNQTTGSQNGVYVVAAGAWARASDASAAGSLYGGLLVPISEGTTNGNRTAQLTTDDPITIGTTSLTFAMDRLPPLATIAPSDITTGAAQIGTDSAAAHADHVHTLTAAVAIAALALAATAISVNSQKVTNLANGTVSTDAVNLGQLNSAIATAVGTTVAPANPGDNGKIAYANAGALAYATSVKTDGTYVSIGASSSLPTQGAIRLVPSAGSGGIWFRNNILNADISGLFSGTDDVLYLGDSTNSAGVNLRSKATGVLNAYFGANATLGVQQSSLSFAPVAATSGTAPVALTVTGAAHTGLTASTEPRDVTFALNRTVTMGTGALTNARAVRFQGPTYAFAGASTISVAATVAIGGAPAAGTNATITNSLALWVEGGAAGFGASPAQSGVERFSTNTFQKWRSNVTAADLNGIGFDATDSLVLGDNTNGVAVFLDCATAGTIHLRAGANVFDFTSSALTTNNKNIVVGTGFVSAGSSPAQSGQFRGGANTLIVAGRGSIAGYDVPVASVDGSDHLVIGGSGTNSPTTNYYNTRTSGQHIFQVNATDVASISSSFLDLKSLVVLFGTGSPTNAKINLPNNAGATMAAMSVGGVNPIQIIGGVDTSDVIRFGDASYATKMFFDIKTGGDYGLFIGGTLEYDFFPTYADWKDNQLRFGSSPSTNALIGVSYSASSTSIMSTKDSGGTDRNLIVFTSLNHAQFGSGLISTDIIAQGNTWAFGSTAAFPGVDHFLAAGAKLRFGSAPSSSAIVNFSTVSTLLAVRNNAGSADLPVLTTDAGDQIFVGNTSSNLVLNTSSNIELRISGGLIIGATGGFISGTAVLNFENNKPIIAVENAAHSGAIDVLRVDNTNAIYIGLSGASTVSIGGTSAIIASTNLGFYSATPVAKPSVSGSRSGGAALTNLLTALASQGLITNSTSA